MPSVSVIIPAYQCSTTIRESLESVFAQSVPVDEIIVIDDGSTDELDEAILPYENKIVLLHQKNMGSAVARNNGIKHSTGEFISFLDSDDIWLPEKLALQLPLFANPEVGVVFGNVEFLSAGNIQKKTYFDLYKPYRGDVFLPLYAQNYIPMLSVIIRKRIFQKFGLFDETIRNGEDYELNLRVAKECKFDFVKEPIAIYRISSNQKSKDLIKSAEALVKLKENVFISSQGIFTNAEEYYIEKGLYNKFLRLAMCYLREGKKKEASRTLDHFRQSHRKTVVYLAFRLLLLLPVPIMKFFLRIWDRIHQKPEYGYI